MKQIYSLLSAVQPHQIIQFIQLCYRLIYKLIKHHQMQQTNPQLMTRQHRYKVKADHKTKQALDIIERLKAKKQKKKLLQTQLHPQTFGQNPFSQLTQIQPNHLDNLYFQVFGKHFVGSCPAQLSKQIVEYMKEIQQQARLTKLNDNMYLNEIKGLELELEKYRERTEHQKLQIKGNYEKQLIMLRQKAQAQQKDKQLIQLKSKQEAEVLRKQLTELQSTINQMSANILSLKLENQSIPNLKRELDKAKQNLNVSQKVQLNYKKEIQEMHEASRRQKDKLNNLQQEIDNMTQITITQSSSLKSSEELLKLQNSELNQSLKTLQDKNSELTTQLSQLLYSRQQVDSEAEQHIKRLNQQIKDLEYCLQNEHQQLLKLHSLQQEAQLTINSNNQLLYQHKHQLCLLQEQNLSLTDSLKTKTKQLTSAHSQSQAFRQISQNFTALKLTHQELKDSYQQLKKFNQSLTDKNQHLNKRVQTVEQEREQQLEAFQITIKNLQEVMDQERKDYQNQLSSLKTTINKLSLQLNQSATTSENQPKDQLTQNKTKESHIKTVSNQLIQITDKYNKVNQQLASTVQQLQSCQKENTQLKLRFSTHVSQNLPNESTQQKIQGSRSSSSGQHLKQIKELNQQIGRQREKYACSSSNLYQQIQSLNEQVKCLQNQNNELIVQLNHLKQLSVKSAQTHHNLNDQLHKITNQLSRNQKQLSKLNQQNQLLTSQNQRLSQQIQQITQQLNLTAQQLNIKNESVQTITQQLNSKTQELKRAKLKHHQLQQKLAQQNHLRIQNQHLLSQLKSSSPIQQLKSQSPITHNSANSDSYTQINNLKFQIVQLQNSILEIGDLNDMITKQKQQLSLRVQQQTQRTSQLTKQLTKVLTQKLQLQRLLQAKSNLTNQQNQPSVAQSQQFNSQINQLQKLVKTHQLQIQTLSQQLNNKNIIITNLSKQLQHTKLQFQTFSVNQKAYKANDNRHIKTIEHLTIQLQNAYSEINLLKQSLMKKSTIKMDDSLLNDSLLDQSYREQPKLTKFSPVKTSLNLKIPPKSTVGQRTNSIIQPKNQSATQEKSEKKEGSKEKEKRNGSIKKIAGYFGF